MIGPRFIELALDRLEQSSIQGSGLLAGENSTIENDFADVESVSQKLGK
jgi:hypothetical protein